MKNERGFSLMELIIVIAIIAVFSSILGLSLSYISSTNSKTAKSKIVNALDNTKMIATAKSTGGDITFSQENGKYYYKIGTEDKVAICNAVVGLSYSTDNSNYTHIDDGDTYNIQFKKATGGLNSSSNIYIKIGKYTICVYQLTGKVEVIGL